MHADDLVGRPVAAAMRVMLIELVLVARMHPSGAAASRSAKIFSLRSTFSVATSTTNRQATAAPKSVDV